MFVRMWSLLKKIEMVVGKGIGMYIVYEVMVNGYCSLNWLFYKVMIVMFFFL